MLLALCLWEVCAADYSTLGLFDRAGNIKFQDFFQFPVSASLIAQGREVVPFSRFVFLLCSWQLCWSILTSISMTCSHRLRLCS
jgi:hypothetical protein